MDAVSGGKNMRGKMLFVSIALLVMLFFVETASAQVKVATLEQLQDALAGNDEDIIVTKTIVIDEDLTLNGGGKTVKLDRKASIQVGTGKGNKKISVTFTRITFDGDGAVRASSPISVGVFNEFNEEITLTLGEGVTLQNANTGNNGGGISVCKGTLNMQSGSKIQNCLSYNYGGGVALYYYAALNMDGGRIVNCKANKSGGGVSVNFNSTVQMNSGTILGCGATDYGGGIFIGEDNESENCTVNLVGGTIAKNSAKIGGGVHIQDGSSQPVPEPTPVGPENAYRNRRTSRSSDGNTFNRTGGELCGNTASDGGADLAFIIGNLAAVGTPEGQYKGKTVNGWYGINLTRATTRRRTANSMTAGRRKTYI